MYEPWKTTRASVSVGAGLLCAMLAFAGSASALDDDDEDEKNWLPGEFSANVAFTTDYVYRGISQTDTDPALQGGFDWSHDLGIYAGMWGSNVNFLDGDSGYIETDWYVGWGKTFGDLSVDLNWLYYWYIGSADSLDYDFWELTGGLSYDFGFASLGTALSWSPDFFADSGDAFYLKHTLDVPIPLPDSIPWFDLSASAVIANQWIDNNSKFGTPDYLEWNAGLTLSTLGFDFDFRYHDTDLSRGQCFGGTHLCKARFAFTMSRAF